MEALGTSLTSYNRAQLEHALVACFDPGKFNSYPEHREAYTVFRTRIKKLLDLDRKEIAEAYRDFPHVRYAFQDGKAAGQGVPSEYREHNAFALLVALHLLDAGFKQSEVVLLMKLIREELDIWHERLLSHARFGVGLNKRATNEEAFPSVVYDQSRNPQRVYDPRVFMLIRGIELREFLAVKTPSTFDRLPVFAEAEFCEGAEALVDYLNARYQSLHKSFFIEIGSLAHLSAKFLRRIKAKE